MTALSKVIVYLTLGIALKFAETWAVFTAINAVIYPLFMPSWSISFGHSFVLALAVGLLFGTPKRTKEDVEFTELMSDVVFLTLFYVVSTLILIAASAIFL